VDVPLNFPLFQNSEKILTFCPLQVIIWDPKDNFLLALAKDGNADYLITGDNNLLSLKEFGKTKIVTLSEFETAPSES